VEKLGLDTSTASAVYSLIDEVDSESIADEFDIGKFNKTHDFDNHIKIAVREGIDPSDSLKELEETTDSDDEMEKMAASTFSRYTNDRDYGAELFGAPGVGYEIINASNNLAMDASVAYMLLISLAFLCMDVGFRLFERRLLAWR